jgi:flagellar P-ring protein precursor FlgI
MKKRSPGRGARSVSQLVLVLILLSIVSSVAAQTTPTKLPIFRPRAASKTDTTAGSQKSNTEVVGIRLKDITRFRGIRPNTLTGVGLVMGLNGTGDSTKVPPTIAMLTSFLKKQGIDADPTTLTLKNAAMVLVTADLEPFAVNGQSMDVTVTSMGDSSSLRNGTLMLTELHAAGNPNVVYATAAGAISVGGYTEGAGGNSQAKGFVTVGRIPSGGIVEQGAPTTMVFEGKMFLELDDYDLTTAQRIETRINLIAPEFHAVALNGGTVQVDLPKGISATTAMAKLEGITVEADTQTSIVINEKTGTIVMGGDVRLSACAIATGSLSVKIEEANTVSQPQALSAGNTTPVKNQSLDVKEDRAQLAVLKANTTIADLAHIFQELKLKPADIINIFQLLKQQGALKARVITE